MLGMELLHDRGIVVLEPAGPLAAEDFDRLAAMVDPYLAEAGALRGVLVDTHRFPGWDGLDALLAHGRFVRGHVAHVKRIAIVTASDFAGMIARVAGAVLPPEVRRFEPGERPQALAWLEEEPPA
ncbi:STAS/SEC14 domain-containing protein [Roseomonas terrae]|uniref:STAS/SEC14 domain-containing protein n=1 Tax=Neoroseomonas terrae TaxID=424799 RepID=A0ABS5EK98_9PROT|nr:STAS/SEC14 domain-containing protein [Neoroseomonas terrae]MBR0651450.1 STAS/SEC14 domain-containing protein [Neoroseomonas terrae]